MYILCYFKNIHQIIPVQSPDAAIGWSTTTK